jgi:hypothetical protein
VTARRSPPLLALLVLAVTLLGAVAAPAAVVPSGARADDTALAPIEIEGIAVPARIGARGFERPVLIPGLYWVQLEEPRPRLTMRGALVWTVARLDLRTLEGWLLAHSTATALP